MRDVVRRTARVWERSRPATKDLAVVAVAMAVVVLITADVLAGGLLTYLDDTVKDATFPSGDPPGWTHVVGLLGNVGVGSTAAVVAAIVTMHARWRWWPGVLVVAQLAATGIMVVALKYLVARPGPGGEALDDGYPGFYPSGHTATAMVSVGVLVFVLSGWRGRSLRRARQRGLWTGAAAGCLVAASSVLGGFHWLSDALASLAIGTAVLVLGFAMADQYVHDPR